MKAESVSDKTAVTNNGAGSNLLLMDDTPSEAVRKILIKNLAYMKAQEQAATYDRPVEGVHQMRVATRRMRSAFRVFKSAVPGAYKDDLLPGIRRTAQQLGAVRDLDVMLIKLRAYQQHRGTLAPEPLLPLRRWFTQQREERRRELLLWLDSPEYATFLHRGHDLLRAPLARNGSPGTSQRVAAIAPALIYGQLAKVKALDSVIEEGSAEQIHDLRIECKKLRYTIEHLKDLLGDKIDPLVASLKVVQDTLGEYNDHHVMLDFIAEAREERVEIPPRHLDDYERHLREDIQRQREAIPGVWKDFLTKKNHKALSKAVGGLV